MRVSTTHVRRLLLVGLLAPLVLALFASPALAASKVEFRDQNIRFSLTIPFVITICGVSDIFTFNGHIGQFSLVQWDNGRFLATFTGAKADIRDSAGNFIARDNFHTKTVTGEGGLPVSVQFNEVTTCAGGSATPGKLFGFHFGFTIGEDGMFKEFHMVFN